MGALREHFADHQLHMIGRGVGGLGPIAGIILQLPILAVTAGIVCAASCVAMIKMMVSTSPQGHHH